MQYTVPYNLDKLLAPISSEIPSGVDLRNDLSNNPIYYRIKEARSDARDLERRIIQGDVVNERPITYWQDVINLSIDVLSTKTKDLDICVWCLEGLLRVHHFKGLAYGFSLIRKLCESYWDTIYPLPDKDGLSSRIASITGLNGDGADGALIFPISNTPITEGSTIGPFCLWQYHEACERGKNTTNLDLEGNVVDLTVFNAAVTETSHEFFKNLIQDMQNCIDEYEKMTNLLAKKCGDAAPPSSQIHEMLIKVLSTVKYITKDVIVENNIKVNAYAFETEEDNHLFDIDQIKNRSEAFGILSKVADYFLNTEPHSPLSYIIKKAIRFGKLSLPDLLDELIDNEAAKTNVFVLVGMSDKNKDKLV